MAGMRCLRHRCRNTPTHGRAGAVLAQGERRPTASLATCDRQGYRHLPPLPALGVHINLPHFPSLFGHFLHFLHHFLHSLIRCPDVYWPEKFRLTAPDTHAPPIPLPLLFPSVFSAFSDVTIPQEIKAVWNVEVITLIFV